MDQSELSENGQLDIQSVGQSELDAENRQIVFDSASEEESQDTNSLEETKELNHQVGYFYWYWEYFGFVKAMHKFYLKELWCETSDNFFNYSGFAAGYFLCREYLIPILGRKWQTFSDLVQFDTLK